MRYRTAIVLGVALSSMSTITTAQTPPENAAYAWRPEFIVTNSAAAIKAAYPKAAAAEEISGEVVFDCVVGPGGRLDNCKIISEDPPGYGFGDAAFALVQRERVKVNDAAGNSLIGRPLKSLIRFPAPGDSGVTWLRKPRSDELDAVVPFEALKQGKDGRVGLNCAVTVDGFLQNCKVETETPAGLGYGGAALLLTSQFRVKPRVRDGKPVASSQLRFAINWKDVAYLADPLRDKLKTVLRDPPWIKAPTFAQVQAAWPARATNVMTGQVSLRCEMDKTGALKDCEVSSESPKTIGLGRVALALSRNFQVRLEPEEVEDIKDMVVDVPFRFRNPTEQDTRKVTTPTWIAAISDESVALIYPKPALEAGVMKGLGVLSCTIEAAGTLKDCKVQRESPEGLGFGTAAMAASKYMVVNPWSKEGDPLEGLSVNLPLQLVFPADEPKTAP